MAERSLFLLAEIIKQLIPAEEIQYIFEVGARDCEESVAFAELYGNAKLFAFECNPETLPACRKNAQKFPDRIVLIEAAASDTEGETTFFQIDTAKTQTTHTDGNPGASSLLKASGKYPVEKYVQQPIMVKTVRLDSIIKKHAVEHIDILWLDVQGAELLVLDGMKDSIQNVSIIHAEVSFMEIYSDQPLFEDVNTYLTDKGFVLIGFMEKNSYFGDALFLNRGWLLKRQALITEPLKAYLVEHGIIQKEASFAKYTSKTYSQLVLHIKYGGLGDHLFFSHIPRIAKEAGYEKVFISNYSAFRHPDYKKLIWELNPYVDGFIDQENPLHDFAAIPAEMNLLDYFMLLLKLDDNKRFHEPELYYQPNKVEALQGKTMYDPNFVSYVGEVSEDDINYYFTNHNISVDFQMKVRDKSLSLKNMPAILETKNLEEFCDILVSCEKLYCLASGTATLAAALGKSAHVLYGNGQKTMFHHSMLHGYIRLPEVIA